MTTHFHTHEISPNPLPHGWKTQEVDSHSKHSWSVFLRHNSAAQWALGAAILSFFVSPYLSDYNHLIKASLVNIPQVEFTGAEFPIHYVGDRTVMTEAERNMHFDQISPSKKIPLPTYDTAVFQSGVEWRQDNRSARQAYTTWSVPNSGNYKLDGTENSGSHPGVDIVTPTGTPVHAMAAGIVTKVDTEEYGFGKFIVITHPNAPTLHNPSERMNLRSLYAHLSEQLISEGDVVQKGQLIGKVGSTGSSTTPHLHWQIETTEAPFSPYWPFSTRDLQAHGTTSFFEGVKLGVGQENVRRYTVHPAQYIAQNRTAVASTDTDYRPDPTPEATDNPSVNGITLFTDEDLTEGSNVIKVWIPRKDNIDPYITVRTSRPGVTVSPSQLTYPDFIDDVANLNVAVVGAEPFTITLSGPFGERTSNPFAVTGTTTNTTETTPEIQAQSVFPDVDTDHPFAAAITHYSDAGVLKGYPDGTFGVTNGINRAEALKVILAASNIPEQWSDRTFPDVSNDAWFAPYVKTAVARAIVNGYPDGNFRPAQTVTRAEFLKMSIVAAGFSPPNVTFDVAADVPASAWFTKYFAFAQTNNLLPHTLNTHLRPGETLTRGEAVYILHKLFES